MIDNKREYAKKYALTQTLVSKFGMHITHEG